MRCRDCGETGDDVGDNWEPLEGIPLCGDCVMDRIREAGGPPPGWEIDYA